MTMSNDRAIKKLLVVTTSYPLKVGAISGIFVKRLNKSLEQYFNISTLCPDGVTEVNCKEVIPVRYAPKKYQLLAHQPGGIPVALKNNRWLFFLVPIFLLSLFFKTLRELKKNNFVLAHWGVNGLVAGIANIFFRKPLVTVFHGTDANSIHKSRISKWFLNLTIRLSSSVVVVSRSLYTSLNTHFPNHSQKIIFIANGVEEDLLNVTPRESINFCFVTIANLNPLKGVGDILHALALVGQVECKLIVIGDGPQRTELEELADRLQLNEQVMFTGVIPPKGVKNYIEDCDALILASYSEGRPSVVLEAMAAGRTIIASKIPGNIELVQHGVSGLLFEAGNVQALTSCMKQTLNSKDELISMGKEGRKFIIDNHLIWPQTAQQYLQLFDGLQNNKC